MDKERYLQMLDAQISESKMNADIAERLHREANAKYNALLESKKSYIVWVVHNEATQKS
jgi:hypothetical protein